MATALNKQLLLAKLCFKIDFFCLKNWTQSSIFSILDVKVDLRQIELNISICSFLLTFALFRYGIFEYSNGSELSLETILTFKILSYGQSQNIYKIFQKKSGFNFHQNTYFH